MESPAAGDTRIVEVLVIGGGITGLAVARACEQAGLHSILIEKGELGGATSANSLRIIHGGFRYLQSLDILRVVRSLKDQARVRNEFPDLVRLLPCYLPLNRFGLKSRWPLTVAALLYRMLGMAAGIEVPETRTLTRDEAEAALPLLKGHVRQGAFLWHDLQLVEPSALHQRLSQQIAELGGRILSASWVEKVERAPNGFRVKVRSAGSEFEVAARLVIDCSGPWAGTCYPDSGTPDSLAGVGWCRGFNLIFKDNRRGTFGAGFPGEKGRLYFVVGRNGETAVGTGYVPCENRAAASPLSDAEIDEFIASIDRAVPELGVERARLVRVELGVLPLTAPGVDPEHNLVGSARISDNGGYVSVLSTKYTTFLSQADAVVQQISHYFRR